MRNIIYICLIILSNCLVAYSLELSCRTRCYDSTNLIPFEYDELTFFPNDYSCDPQMCYNYKVL